MKTKIKYVLFIAAISLSGISGKSQADTTSKVSRQVLIPLRVTSTIALAAPEPDAVIESFSAVFVSSNSVTEFYCTGNMLSVEAITAFYKLKSGDRLYIEKIRVKNKDGKKSSLPDIAYQII